MRDHSEHHDHTRPADHSSQGTPGGSMGHASHHGHVAAGPSHHAHMVADFKRRFWVSLVFTLPVLALARHIQGWLGLGDTLAFPGASWLQFALASVIYFYGGWPFLAGLVGELRARRPGMMTLIGLAI